MKISLVIVNYNTPNDTIECLNSLYHCPLPKSYSLEIILVDNASTDDSVTLLSKKFPSLPLLISPSNLGFVGGNNLGIQKALESSPDLVILLNPDTLLDKHFFTHLSHSSFLKNPRLGLLTPKIYFAKGFEFHKQRYAPADLGKVIWGAGGVIDWNNLYAHNAHVDEIDRGQFTTPLHTDFATGACLIIKTPVIRQIGLLDKHYFLYLEDLEYSVRARKFGWQILFDPKLVIWHKVAQSSGVGSNLNDYFITRNRLLFGFRYAPLRTKLALIRQSLTFLSSGTPAQKTAVTDFLRRRFGKGSWLK